ncbi:hypothetical protein JRO89_XS05G0106000 [Xanthoceras sorbifolium]|uniref:BAHD acyltransferase n=1 Tax=Xanthoceras sorbifolium TaxID=99658 RepID=A0ABQ8I1X2_9ROSI|nr:hypothetical protein JRO89_XS05G0106000 [Xanthoceras sorbifolium]
MKVEIIARETIKPTSPTPQSLRDFKLSLIDQLAPPAYTSLLFLYSFNGDTDVCVSERSQQLKKSFSNTLALFYPLAGRLKDNIVIDCSDYGAVYVEARVDCPLVHLLEQPNGDKLTQLIPIEIESTEAITGGFVSLVQASFFYCGGVAFGVCISYKLADAATVATSMRCWAATTTTSGSIAAVLLYNEAALFPPREFSAEIPSINNFVKEKFAIKRFVFDASKVAALKAVASSVSVKRPTRAEVVSRVMPSLPKNSVGNLVGFYTAQKDHESEIKLQGLVQRTCISSDYFQAINLSVSAPAPVVRSLPATAPTVSPVVSPAPSPHPTIAATSDYSSSATAAPSPLDFFLFFNNISNSVSELREGMQVFDKNYVKMLETEDAFEAVTNYFKEAASQIIGHDVEFYTCTSLCNNSMYDHLDFGWGRPVWVMIPSMNNKNVMELIDTKKGDGSIEAWMILSRDDMDLFEHDSELLAYASVNPSVLDYTDTNK